MASALGPNPWPGGTAVPSGTFYGPGNAPPEAQAQILPPGNQLQNDFYSPQNQARLAAMPGYQAQQKAMANSQWNNQLLGQWINWQQQSSPEIASLNAQHAGQQLEGSLTGQMNQQQQTDLRQRTSLLLQQAGLAGKEAANDKNYANTQIGNVNHQFRVSSGAARQGYSDNLNALYSDATARGAVSTAGTRQGRGSLQAQLNNNLKQAGVTRDYDLARWNRTLQNADVMAQKAGLDRDTYMQQMNSGLAQLGLQGQIDQTQLMEAMTGTDAKKAAAAQAIVNNAMQLAAQNPDFFQQFSGMMPGSNPAIAPQTTYGSSNIRFR
jgi:hypothetical protein